jgi:hypothetical protein
MRRLVLVALCLTSVACAAPLLASDRATPIDAGTLAERLTALERKTAESEPGTVRGLVRQFAEQMVHAEVEVTSGRVIQTYTREGWKTRPYFAVSYDRETYVYTEQIDPGFQDELAAHMHWVSVVKSLPDRQLMFELAIDEKTFGALQPQEMIDFTCEIAGIIRGGKSVYSRLVALKEAEKRDSKPKDRDR